MKLVRIGDIIEFESKSEIGIISILNFGFFLISKDRIMTLKCLYSRLAEELELLGIFRVVIRPSNLQEIYKPFGVGVCYFRGLINFRGFGDYFF